MNNTPDAKRRKLAAEPPQTPLSNICKYLNISPPKYFNSETKTREQMTLEEIEQAVALDGFGSFCKDHHKAVLIFLYGRKFGNDYLPTTRQDTVRNILSSATAAERILKIAAKDGDTDLLLEEDDGEQPQQVESPDIGMRMRTTQANPYSLWMASIDDWTGVDGSVTIASKFDIKLVLRRQFSTNCFIHAPGVLQGYLVQKGTGVFQGMIDFTKFIRDLAEDEFLASLVLTDNGGASIDLLGTLLPSPTELKNFRLWADPSTSTVAQTAKDELWTRILNGFNEYGPALISQCKLDHHFLVFEQEETNEYDPYDKYEIPVFDEYVPTKEKGTHAMVLVGYRDDGGNRTLLLQNWWNEMQFCEVSLIYLMKSNAWVTFCCEEQRHFGVGQQLTSSKFAEAKFQDRADGYLVFDASIG